jgi:tetratricopeptide (TPR) repeat protein
MGAPVLVSRDCEHRSTGAMAYKVFLSSTSRDLANHREAVERAILRLEGFMPIVMENFGARDATASQIDEAKVRECDVFVGLVGHCYGSSPKDNPTSYTEQEFDLATALGRLRLMLVASDEFRLPASLREPEERHLRQVAFRARVLEERVVAMFDDPAGLAGLVTQALANWRAEREKVDPITADLVAAKEAAARHEARAAELERALQEGQREREELRAAVEALAEKAREPDAPRNVQQALALLPEGRTAEAEAIFAEIVERKQVEGTAALQEAAAAARHLGALAYLDSTQKALEAYATATRLDPDNAWSWIHLGLLHKRAGSLAQAERALDQAQQAAIRSGQERDQSVAQAYLGDIRLAQGNLRDALAAYDEAVSVQQRLADNTERQRDLSVCFERIGDVQRAQGNLDATLKAYQDGLNIREKLAARDPSNAGWQFDLGLSVGRIGDLLIAQGQLLEGLASIERASGIFAKLVATDPSNSEWQRDLSVSYNKIGDVQRARGNLDAALKAYGDSLAIRKKLATQDPSNAQWQRDLSVSFEKIGDVQCARGDLEARSRPTRTGSPSARSWLRRTRATLSGSATSRSASSRSATCSARGAIWTAR